MNVRVHRSIQTAHKQHTNEWVIDRGSEREREGERVRVRWLEAREEEIGKGMVS